MKKANDFLLCSLCLILEIPHFTQSGLLDKNPGEQHFNNTQDQVFILYSLTGGRTYIVTGKYDLHRN